MLLYHKQGANRGKAEQTWYVVPLLAK